MTPAETLRAALAADTDECIIWPHTVNSRGYPHMRQGRAVRLVHRLVLMHHVGPPPDGAFALHGPCRNTRCINHRHLRWGTVKDNNTIDRLRDGTYGTKLTADDVSRIRQLYSEGQHTQQAIATMFGCSQSHVGNIVVRRLWSIVP